ncbi:TonB-dependent receptor [Gluconacetobacter sp. Hr-1-5]|uniref:TonB-dependent receptor n=1 Tax=Gluconacetobacter sp. Hr-1-5 TaxID=3395370 RepID=UPI003B5267B0
MQNALPLPSPVRSRRHRLLVCAATIAVIGPGICFAAAPQSPVAKVRKPVSPITGKAPDTKAASQAATKPGKMKEATEEITVVAQKTGRSSLMTTPMSISVVTAADLKRLAATQFSDFADTVPGLHYTTQGAGRATVNIRGVTTGTDITPTVGFYIDDVPYGSSTAWANASSLALDAGLFDLSQIEVLRGPQGTLYGASTMGGLIDYHTSDPSLTDVKGTIRSGVSTTQGALGYNGGTSINIPIWRDKLAFRLSDYYYHNPGWVNDAHMGRQDVNQADTFGLRGELLFKPTENFDMRLSTYGQNIEQNGTPYVDMTLPQVGNANLPLFGSMNQYDYVKEPFSNHFRIYSGTIHYRTPYVNITSISSWQTIRTKSVADESLFYVPLLKSVGLDREAESFLKRTNVKKVTEELRLSSTGHHPLEWLVGGFFTKEDVSNYQYIYGYSDVATDTKVTDLSASVPTSYLELAAFGNLTYHVTPKLDLMGGIRYSYNQQSFTLREGGTLGGEQSLPVDTHQGVVLYMGNIRYRFNSQMMAYGRIASGYRPGGPNSVFADPVTHETTGTPSFSADRLTSYEVGYKGAFLNRRILVDTTGYFIYWRNIQSVLYSSGVSYIGNGGSARIFGLEGTITFNPIDGLRIIDSINLNQSQLATSALSSLGGYAGDQLPNSPRFTNSLIVDYRFPVFKYTGDIGATINYIGPRVAGFNYQPGAEQYRMGDYTTLGLNGGITFGKWDMQIYLHNLNNSHGIVGAQTSLGYGQIAMLQPRTAGFNLSAAF